MARAAALQRLDTVDDVLGWFAMRGVRGLASDSRRVAAGDAFIAWPGQSADARRFVPRARAAGAAVCLLEDEGLRTVAEELGFERIEPNAIASFPGLKAATGEIADRWYGEPSRRLDVLAVTGTNGKTSTAWWLAQALSQLGSRCGVIGTLGIGEPPRASTGSARTEGEASAGSARTEGEASTGSARTEGEASTSSARTEGEASTGSARTEEEASTSSVRMDGEASTSSARTGVGMPEPVRPEPFDSAHDRPIEGPAPVSADHAGAPETPMPMEPTGLTTPGPIEVHAALCRFVDASFAACAIEATSIGMAEHRLAGVRIGIALFTNFTQDHLDYHGSMAAYWEAKAQLFAWPGLRAAVVNVDDAHGAALAESLAAPDRRDSPLGGALDLWTCSAAAPARLRASNVRYVAPAEGGGLAFDLAEQAAAAALARAVVRTRIVGDFHVANLLVTIGGLRAAGVPLAAAVEACARLTPVPGRMQPVAAPTGAGADAAPIVVVDYAHTPDALEKALTALRPLAAQRGGALWCVFGCGGDRDPAKRPLMGRIAARLADRTLVTSDNPRSESPEAIVAQIAAGVDDGVGAAPVERIVDRRAAIAYAVVTAAAADVILLAGKGHETTQEIAGVRHPLSDVDEAAAALCRRAGTEERTGC